MSTSRARPGHLFVVAGDLHNLDADVVVIPTDTSFHVEPHWQPAFTTHPADAKPEDWERQGWGQARGNTIRPTWFISVTDQDLVTTPEVVAKRLQQLLVDVAKSGVIAGHDRQRPLVSLPAIGVGKGGLGYGVTRGQMLAKLVQVGHEVTADQAIDVVVVARNAADYSALQHARRGDDSLSEQLEEVAQQLAGRLGRGEVALFLGAGVSIGAGLPAWGELLRGLAHEAGIPRERLDELSSPLDQAELISRRLGERLGGAIVERITTERYGLTHSLLAAMGVAETVTTNYDQLYEMALKDATNADIRILPSASETVDESLSWVLKMHGDLNRQKSIILSRRDFVRYDALWRPLAAVVQSLLLTRHLVVVGASLSDDNVLRLAHEVMALREDVGGAAARSSLGTVLSLWPSKAEQMLWEGRLDFVAVSSVRAVSTVDEERRAQRAEQARDLAIFLDRVGVIASRPAHVLDERYQDLLDSEDERAAARLGRELADAIDRLPSSVRWASLRSTLRELGSRHA